MGLKEIKTRARSVKSYSKGSMIAMKGKKMKMMRSLTSRIATRKVKGAKRNGGNEPVR